MVHDVWFALRFFLFLSSASFGLELNAKELALSRSRHVGNRHSGSTFLASRYDADHGLKAPPWAICKGIMQDTYSASWLTNADFIRKLAYEPERLYKRGTNMEGASFLLFQVKGSVKIKTMDMLDLFVEHLSWYVLLVRVPPSLPETFKGYSISTSFAQVREEAALGHVSIAMAEGPDPPAVHRTNRRS
jgi:hypothetical protein